MRNPECSLGVHNGGMDAEFSDLRARSWYELFTLFEAQPRVHLCPLCERVYVPRTAAQRRCQLVVYTWPDIVAVRGCAPLPRLDADRHRREYKRLAEALRRARLQHGEKSLKARQVCAILHSSRIASTNYGHVGRPPKGETPITARRPRRWQRS